VIRNLISHRSPSAVASATAGSCIAPTPTRLKTSQTCYHRNQQYSIVGLTNAAGTLVERYTYSAYGTLGIYAASGTVRTSSTYANRYTYTGREWDVDLRLYHFRARWYDPATGGFVSRDPLGYVDGMSLYRGYFGVSGIDPHGNDWVWPWDPRAEWWFGIDNAFAERPQAQLVNPHKNMSLKDIVLQHWGGGIGLSRNVYGPRCIPIPSVPGMSVCVVVTITGELSVCCNNRGTKTQYWDLQVIVELYGQYGKSFNPYNPGRGGRNDRVKNPHGGPDIKRKHAEKLDDGDFGYRDRVGHATFENILNCEEFGFQYPEGEVFIRGSAGVGFAGVQFAVTQKLSWDFDPIFGWNLSGSLATGVVGLSAEIGGGLTGRLTIEHNDTGTPCCVH
jgi:RHS repeat-associated protein